MRRITFSRCGLHFETNGGAVNAHWRDLFGIGLSKTIKHHFFLSIKRFWVSVANGIRFLITGKFKWEK